MTYTKLGFSQGQVLTAEAMNHIETGIDEAHKATEKKQDKLVSGTNLKTINGKSLLGSGDIHIEGGSGGSSVSQAINYDLNVKAINHRGYSAESPENTIPAYIMSKQKGFTYVECDVSFTSDGVAVLLHDATIDRTSNGSGSISKMTYAKALTYDFGSWFSADFAGVKIPTFTEFIMTCKGLGLHPYIELKSNGSYTQAQITQIVDEVESCGMKGKVTYISFSNTFLGYVKNADPEARLGYLLSTVNSTGFNNANALRSGTNEVFIDARLSNLTASIVKSCVDKGFPLEVWTVNTEAEIKSMPNYVTGVTSDYLVAGRVLYEKYSVYTPPSIGELVPATAISLSKTSLSFTTVNSQTLTATVTPSNSTDKVTWKSSNTAVATVSNGVVTPVKDGDCTITATAGSVSASCSVTVDVPNSFSITRNLVGCKTDSSVNLVIEGEAHTETFSLLNDGYSFDGATVSVTMGGQDISNLVVDNVLTIPSVTGDIVINFTAKALPSYSITRNLVGCESSSTVSKVTEGKPHTETFSALGDGYSLNGAIISVTMGGQDISNKVVDGVLTIESVTGNIVINITAKEVVTYNITRNLVGCRSSGTTTVIKEGDALTEAITVIDDSYTLEGVTISATMGDEDISNQVVDGVLTIASVTGDVVISATANLVNSALPYPVVDLVLSNATDGIIVNGGTGGATYSTTVKGGQFTSDANGISLLTTAYIDTPISGNKDTPLTICVKGSFDELNINKFQRLFRTDQDAPSVFIRHEDDDTTGVKLVGSSNYLEKHSDICTIVSGQNNVHLSAETVGNAQHTYVFVIHPTDYKVYLYFDGVLIASQKGISSLKEFASCGIGNNQPTVTYYANKLTFSKFKAYDQVLTASQIALL